MPSRGPAGLAEFSNGMERPGVFQTVCLPAECFALPSPFTALSLSLSLSLSSSTLDQHQSSPPLAATLKRRSLTPSIEIFRVIRTNIFDHLRESIARIAERR